MILMLTLSGAREALPARAESRPSDLIGVPVARGSSAPPDAGTTIVTLSLDAGSSLSFVLLAEGRVGVAERAPSSRPLLSDLLVASYRATPLEIFLALARAPAQPPVALLRDHAATSREAPRVLTVPSLYGVPIDNFDCDPSTLFEDAWHDTYDGVTERVVTESYEDFGFAQFDWYPGSHVYHGTNDNLTTHFGICSADPKQGYSVEVQRKVKTQTADGPEIVWHTKVWAGLGYNARFTFHTNLPGSYRMRFTATDATAISELAAGAAYTPSPSVGIEQPDMREK